MVLNIAWNALLPLKQTDIGKTKQSGGGLFKLFYVLHPTVTWKMKERSKSLGQSQNTPNPNLFFGKCIPYAHLISKSKNT